MEYIDMHCDTISRLHKSREKEGGEDLYENSGHVDLRRLKKGGALMQNFAVFICMEETQEPRQEALRMCRLYSAQVQKYEKYISPVLSYGQIEENRREGKAFRPADHRGGRGLSGKDRESAGVLRNGGADDDADVEFPQ